MFRCLPGYLDVFNNHSNLLFLTGRNTNNVKVTLDNNMEVGMFSYSWIMIAYYHPNKPQEIIVPVC